MNKDLEESGTMLAMRENNKILAQQSFSLKMGIFLGYLFFGLLVWVIYYVISNNVVNNIVAKCL